MKAIEKPEITNTDVAVKVKIASRNKKISAAVLIVGSLLMVIALLGSGGESAGGIPVLAVILGVLSFYRYKKIEKQLIETGESKQLERDKTHNKIALIIFAVVIVLFLGITLFI